MIVFSPRAVVKSAVRGLKSLLGFFDNPLVFCLVCGPGSGLEYLFERVGQECEAFENQVGFHILLGMGAVEVIGKPL